LTIYLLSLPVIAVIGALSRNTAVLMLLVPLILIAVWRLYRTEYLPFDYYLAVICISLSLIFPTTLITTQLIGADVHLETYYALRAADGWNPQLMNLYNSSFVVVFVLPFLSRITGLSIPWVLKTIFPFIYTVLPVLMLGFYRRFMGYRNAFLSVFLFMSVTTYFPEMNRNTDRKAFR
jgi:uncharacterized membrane protein